MASSPISGSCSNVTSPASSSTTTVTTTFWLLEGGGCTDVVRCGTLHVKAPLPATRISLRPAWQKRYVILRDTWHMQQGSAALDVYNRKSVAMTTGGRHHAIDLGHVTAVGEHVGSRRYQYSFYVTTDSASTTVFGAESDLDAKGWIAAIRTLADKVQSNSHFSTAAQSVSAAAVANNNNCISKAPLLTAARLVVSTATPRCSANADGDRKPSMTPPPVTPRRPRPSALSLQEHQFKQHYKPLKPVQPQQQQQQQQSAAVSTAAEPFQVYGRKLTEPELTRSIETETTLHLNEFCFERRHTTSTSLVTSTSVVTNVQRTESGAVIVGRGINNRQACRLLKEASQDSGFSEGFEDQHQLPSSPAIGSGRLVTSRSVGSPRDDLGKTRARVGSTAVAAAAAGSARRALGQKVVCTVLPSDDVISTSSSSAARSSPPVPPRPRQSRAPCSPQPTSPAVNFETTSPGRLHRRRPGDVDRTANEGIRTRAANPTSSAAAAAAVRTVQAVVGIEGPPVPPPRPLFTFH